VRLAGRCGRVPPANAEAEEQRGFPGGERPGAAVARGNMRG
jgi:hypothetical protein